MTQIFKSVSPSLGFHTRNLTIDYRHISASSLPPYATPCWISRPDSEHHFLAQHSRPIIAQRPTKPSSQPTPTLTPSQILQTTNPSQRPLSPIATILTPHLNLDKIQTVSTAFSPFHSKYSLEHHPSSLCGDPIIAQSYAFDNSNPASTMNGEPGSEIRDL